MNKDNFLDDMNVDDEIFNELINKRLNYIPEDRKLNYRDIKRIRKCIQTSIFDKDNCSIWNGYVTNKNKIDKGTYINFYYNKKKQALHRLLYSNYIEELSEDEYLKFNCKHKGICCNVHHLEKFKYNKKDNISNQVFKNIKSKTIDNNDISISNDDDITINFS